MSTCLTCQNWLPKETPRWAVRLQMACCALKNTRAVTLSHWAACSKHQQADQKVVDGRTVWLSTATPMGQR